MSNSDIWISVQKMRLPLLEDTILDRSLVIDEDKEYTLMVKVSLKKTEHEGERITYVLAQTGDYQIVP